MKVNREVFSFTFHYSRRYLSRQLHIRFVVVIGRLIDLIQVPGVGTGFHQSLVPSPCLIIFYGQASRPISTGQLSTLLYLHTRPINVVVYNGPSGVVTPGDI